MFMHGLTTELYILQEFYKVSNSVGTESQYNTIMIQKRVIYLYPILQKS